jgi:hypothetical protein
VCFERREDDAISKFGAPWNALGPPPWERNSRGVVVAVAVVARVAAMAMRRSERRRRVSEK